MRRRTAVVGGAVVLAVAAGAALLAVVTREDAEPALPTAEGRAFLAAWAAGDAAGVDGLARTGSGASADQARFREELGLVSSTLTLGPVLRAEAGATATVDAVHLVRGLGEWKVQSQLRFTREEERWLVDWAPSALHPDAEKGDRFERERVRGARAPILGAGGEPLVGLGKVVGVGVQPSRITDRAAVAAALHSQIGFAPERLDRALNARGVKPDHFVPIIELREDRFRQVEGVLRPVPGIIFKRTEARIPPAEGFAAHTLGRTGEITAEQLEQLGPTYEKGDVVGQSGLELVYESTLAGQPSGEVRLVRASGVQLSLHRFEGTPPAPLQTTMRPDVQRAADAALDGVAVPAALVAVEAATGSVLAVASRPLDQPLNRALAGRYPPGSTFKIVTTDALVAKGGADQRLACPPEAEVGGKTFENFEDEALGDTTLRDAFVHSCNTAFVAGAAGLTNEELVAAAGRFGFGVDYRVGLGREHPAVFPVPRDAAERAAAAIGQARVLATPAHMASVLAAATTGTWHSPHLVTLPGDDAIPVATATPTPAAVEPLKAFLRGVVAEGTGKAAAALADLVGKTGTAEFGSGDPLPTHAWFVGQRAGVAFAVLLEGGGVGGRDAAPVGARFAAVL
ncbi:MAG: penicillin-binding transpeptidase domain-containing protein [Actinomycetota bacterium]